MIYIRINAHNGELHASHTAESAHTADSAPWAADTSYHSSLALHKHSTPAAYHLILRGSTKRADIILSAATAAAHPPAGSVECPFVPSAWLQQDHQLVSGSVDA